MDDDVNQRLAELESKYRQLDSRMTEKENENQWLRKELEISREQLKVNFSQIGIIMKMMNQNPAHGPQSQPRQMEEDVMGKVHKLEEKIKTLTSEQSEVKICQEQSTQNSTQIQFLLAAVEKLNQSPATDSVMTQRTQALEDRMDKFENSFQSLTSTYNVKCRQISKACAKFTNLQVIVNTKILQDQSRAQAEIELKERLGASEEKLKDIESQILLSTTWENATIADLKEQVLQIQEVLQTNDRRMQVLESQRVPKSSSKKDRLVQSDSYDRKRESSPTRRRPVASYFPNEENPQAMGDSGTKNGAKPDLPLPNSSIFSVGVSTKCALTEGIRTPLDSRVYVYFPSEHVTEKGMFQVPRDGAYELTVSLWQGGEGKLEAGVGWGGNRWWWHLGKSQSVTDVISTSMIRRFSKDDKISVWVIRISGRAVVQWCTFSGKFIHS